MKSPWANILLLLLLFVQLTTGYFGFTNGRLSFQWILWLHGIGAYCLVILLYWKSSIILDTFRRKKVWSRRRIGFLGLVLLLLATLATGLTWTYYGPIHLAGFSLISIHIYLAIPLMLLMLWHSWHMRFIFKVSKVWGRRGFIRSGGMAFAGLLFWRSVDKIKEEFQVPGEKRRFTGSYERGSFTGLFPSVSWIADRPSPINTEHWQLIVDGAVERPLHLTYNQLLNLAVDQQVATLDCTGGWYTTQVWQGVNIARLLDIVGIKPGAASVTVEAVSGYRRRFRVDEINQYLLALMIAGEPLTHGHGFPTRLVASDQRGLNWVKWVTRIRVNETSKLWQLPLPLQ